MSYILGLIAVTIFFGALHYFTELNHKQKIATTLLVAVIISLMVGWNVMSEKEQQHIKAVILKYNQNKTVTCEGVDVNKTTFDLSTGTQTFIGREGTPHYSEMYSASDCE